MRTNASSQLARPIRLLTRALQQDILLGRQLLAIAHAQTDALMANDAARLSALEAEGRAVLAQQEAAGRQREAAARTLAAALGLEAGPEQPLPALSQIALRLPLTDARKVTALRAEILAVDREIKGVNAHNRGLIRNALDFIQVSLDSLSDPALRPARYGAKSSAALLPTFYLDRKC